MVASYCYVIHVVDNQMCYVGEAYFIIQACIYKHSWCEGGPLGKIWS